MRILYLLLVVALFAPACASRKGPVEAPQAGSFTLQIEKAIKDCRGSHLQLLWLVSRIAERTLQDRGIGEVIRSLESQGWTPTERLFGARAVYTLRAIDVSPLENRRADLRLWIHCDQEGAGVESETRKVWGVDPELVVPVNGAFEEFRKTARAPADSLLVRSLDDEDLQAGGSGFPILEEAGIATRITTDRDGDNARRGFEVRFDLASQDRKSGYRAMSFVYSTVDPSAESFLNARGVAPPLKNPSGFSGPSWSKN